VVLAPGNAFSLSQSASNFMRFNVSQTLSDRTFQVLDEAMRSARKTGDGESIKPGPDTH
jgi:DNA-binding transcriptional MocR family regulator